MSVALIRSVADMHAVRPRCQKLITSARTELVRCHMQDTNTTPIATKNRTNQMSSVMVVLSQAPHPCTVCLRTFVQTLEKTWLDGKRRPKRLQLPLPESRSAVPLCRLHAAQTWPGDWAGDERFTEAAVHDAHACCSGHRGHDPDCSIHRLAQNEDEPTKRQKIRGKRVGAERRYLANSLSPMQ